MKKMPAFPIKKVSPRVSSFLRPISSYISRFFPNVSHHLSVIGSEISVYEYISIGLVNAFLIFSILFSSLISLSFIQHKFFDFFLFTVGSSSLMFLFSLFYWISYPTVVAKRKSELIEKDLIFVLRDLSVQVSGGMSFKDAIDSISNEYGEITNEMNKISQDISLGSTVEDALEESLHRNVSPVYRSIMVRIINGIRTGADIHGLLSVVITNMEEELKNKIKKYGQEINTWVTLYLVIGIVLPSMGLTLMIMLSSFSGLNLTKTTFYLISFFLIFFHASALSMLKSRRPVVAI